MTTEATGAFAPRPGAAPLARQVWAQATMETRLLLRNGEQLLIALVIPALVLIGGVAASDRLDLSLSHSAVDALTAGVFALAIMSTAFTSLAIATGFERRYGVLKRLGASPLPRHGLLLGKVCALLVVEVLQLVVIGLIGLALGWSGPPSAMGAAYAVVALILGTWAFAALGLLIAGVLRAEATLAAANLVYLVLLAFGGVVLPTSSYGSAEWFVRLLPSGALGDAVRAGLLQDHLNGLALQVLLAWAVVATALTAWTFRWE